MIKVDIVNDVASAAGITRVKAADAVEAVLAALKGALVRDGRIELRGLGVFIVKPRKLGVGRNPRTGVVVPILPGRTVRFKAGKHLQHTGGNAAS